jgi:hypothetical protein
MPQRPPSWIRREQAGPDHGEGRSRRREPLARGRATGGGTGPGSFDESHTIARRERRRLRAHDVEQPHRRVTDDLPSAR